MGTNVDRLGLAHEMLEEALYEREAAQLRFDAAVGTSTEMSAYQRLRRATRRVAAADAAVRRAAVTQEDQLLPA